MFPFLIVLLGAFLWGTIVQQIAEHRRAPNTIQAYSALVQTPSLHELPNMLTHHQELPRVEMSDDVADHRSHDPLDTAHTKLR
jgi:hypothetical protein